MDSASRLDDVLSGRAGGAGVRQLLRSAPARAVLRDLVGRSHSLGRCRLTRVKFKPGRKLSAYYEVAIDGGGVRRSVAVTWIPAEAGVGGEESDDIHRDLAAEAQRRNLTEPFTALVATVDTSGMKVQINPLDAAFPQLIRLSDPCYAREVLGGTASLPSVGTVRFRPGQRHVLRYGWDPRTLTGHRAVTVFAKLYRGDDGARATRVAGELAEIVVEQGQGFAVARPASDVAADGVLLYRRVDGQALAALLRRGERSVGGHLKRAGRLLAILHAGATRVAVGLEERTHHDEIRSTLRACEHIDTLAPELGADIGGLLSRAGDLLDRLPTESVGFCHNDYKSDHLLVTSRSMTLIDFDSCVRAGSALDVGKFLADLRWWLSDQPESAVMAAQQIFLDGYCAAQGADIPASGFARARVYEAILLVKLAARRLRVDSVGWAGDTAARVGDAERILAEIRR